MTDDSKEVGLNDDEYDTLNEDIARGIEEGNRKYGYGNGNGDANTEKNDNPSEKKKKSKPSAFVYKYSQTVPLAEQILLNGKNVFLQIINSTPSISSSIELNTCSIKPNELIAFVTYSFKDKDEINYFIKRAELETLDSLYFKIKSVCKQLIVTRDKETLVLIVSDILYSYFVDLFSTTHYDFIKASPGHGKGAIMATFNLLAYRTIMASGLSGANLLDILGSTEACQATVVEDEFSDTGVDRDEFKRKILKVGYDVNGRVFRTLDGNTSSRHNRGYLPFGQKIIGSEKPPEAKDLEGLVDRMFQIESIKARPKFYVKTVTNEMLKPLERQNPRYYEIISKITYLHKLLLIYRILHHGDIIEEADLNIDDRARELTSPQIFLFNSDMSPDKKALQEILPALSYFLRKKGELTNKTIEAVVYESLNILFEDKDKDTEPEIIVDLDGKTKTVYTISHKALCYKVTELADGDTQTIPNENAFYSTDFDKVTYKRILGICRQRFFGEPDSIGTGKDKVRALTFDKETVDKVGRTFEVVNEIKILNDREKDEVGEEEDSELWSGCAGSNNLGTMGRKSVCTEDKGSDQNQKIMKKTTSKNSDKSRTLEDKKMKYIQENNVDGKKIEEIGQAMGLVERSIKKENRPYSPTEQISVPTSQSTPSHTSHSNSVYADFITEEHLPTLDRTVYRCKEHPETPYYDLEGIEESHFKPYHTAIGNVQ